MISRTLFAAAFLMAAFGAQAGENQPTTNRLQQATPDTSTTTGLNKQNEQSTTTGLSARSQRRPTTNNLESPPPPASKR